MLSKICIIYYRLISEDLTRKKKSKREYLNYSETKDFMQQLNNFFESKVKVLRIKSGEKQTIETLIHEEASLLGKFLRKECEEWMHRFVIPSSVN